MLDFDLSKAILLTYSGLGAAFVVLALLIIFIQLIRLAEAWRGRLANRNADDSLEDLVSGYVELDQSSVDGSDRDSELVAVIAAAVALSVQASRLEIRRGNASSVPTGSSWKEQARSEALASRSMWQRGR